MRAGLCPPGAPAALAAGRSRHGDPALRERRHGGGEVAAGEVGAAVAVELVGLQMTHRVQVVRERLEGKRRSGGHRGGTWRR
jgi:hypothetical protein